MARYRSVDIRMWGDARFAALSPMPPSAQGLWLYLLTGPETGPIPGLFRAGEAALAEALRWPLDAFRRCWEELARAGMAKADWRGRLVWLPNAILQAHNRPANPNVVKGWAATWDELPECPLLEEARAALREAVAEQGAGFTEAFAQAIGEPSAKPFRQPFAEGYGESGTGTGTGVPPPPAGASAKPAPQDKAPTHPPAAADDIARAAAWWERFQSRRAQAFPGAVLEPPPPDLRTWFPRALAAVGGDVARLDGTVDAYLADPKARDVKPIASWRFFAGPPGGDGGAWRQFVPGQDAGAAPPRAGAPPVGRAPGPRQLNPADYRPGKVVRT